jgi:hypothetical protein
MGSMDIGRFRASLSGPAPPDHLGPLLDAVWWAAKGDWDRAHDIAAAEPGPAAAHVHAYLHRLEGDAANAAYWYRQAGRQPSVLPIEQEWTALVAELLQQET